MADMDLPYFSGPVDTFTAAGVDLEGKGHRKSKDKKNAIVHAHFFSIEDWEAIRKKTSISLMSHEDALALMGTADWSDK